MSASAPTSPKQAPPVVSRHHTAVKAYLQVIYALVMHDIKNRFFGSGLGQIVMIMWPFAHIIVLLVVYNLTSRPHPYGESLLQYSAVSIFPFIIFNYVTRWIVLSAMTNKSFLNYTIIKPLDILMARAILETVSITIVGALLALLVMSFGYDIIPADPLDGACAVLGCLFLSFGMGFLNAPFAFLTPFWNIVIALVLILSWLASGVIFVASDLPESVRMPLSYNPLLQCTEWIRVAFYSDYPTLVLDRSYVIECGLFMLAVGLVLNGLLKRFY